MIPKVNKSVKHLIISILENEIFEKLKKTRKDFIVSVLLHILSVKGRINSLQLERFMCMFAINTNTPKNQKIFKEL